MKNQAAPDDRCRHAGEQRLLMLSYVDLGQSTAVSAHFPGLLRFLLQLSTIIKTCWSCQPAFVYLRYAPLVSLQFWALSRLRKWPRLRRI